jgi:hypothetical protein
MREEKRMKERDVDIFYLKGRKKKKKKKKTNKRHVYYKMRDTSLFISEFY